MYVPITRWRKVLSKLVFKQTDSFPRTIRSAGQPGRFEALETRLLLDADAILTHEVTIAKDEDDGNTALHDLSLREALRLASENTDSTLDRI